MKKKIFITGVAGFLGSNLADFYTKKGFLVSGCDNLIGGDLKNLEKKNINFTKTDCENLPMMTKIIKDSDVVVHAAAYAHEGLSSFSPTLISSNNLTGSVSVFTAAIINKVKRVIYCSSMARYGNIRPPFKEDDVCNPVDPYGVSKLAAENILKILAKTHKFQYNIAVPHNIIGPKQKYNDPFRNVVSIMTNLILQNRRPIIFGNGEQKRCFSDIEDCLFCLDKMITDPKIFSQTINIGPDDEVISINELFNILSNKLKFNKEPIYFKDRPNEVKHASCSSDKAKKLLGYKRMVSLNKSIDKIIDYIKINKPKKFSYNYKLEIINQYTPAAWSEKKF
jgi:UDP-glucose 4-epimerase